jgi:hypothetical protein
MKPTEYLFEELDITGVYRYDSRQRCFVTTEVGPKIERGQLFNDLQEAIKRRDMYNEVIESMESFLEEA